MAQFPGTSFEVKQKPTIAEVEVSVVSILLHQLKQLRVQNLWVRRTGWFLRVWIFIRLCHPQYVHSPG